jgi:hypothetical protein
MSEHFAQSLLKIGLVAATAFVASCSAEVGIGVGTAEGSMTVDWTVAGTKDPIACEDFAADTLELVIFDALGEIARTDSACDDFAVVVDLPEGEYDIDATMLDSDFFPISTTVSVDRLTVLEGLDLPVEIDFPADSFF